MFCGSEFVFYFNVKKKKKNLCKTRGLCDGKDTFEMFVTPQFRTHYDRIFADILERNRRQQRQGFFYFKKKQRIRFLRLKKKKQLRVGDHYAHYILK